MAASFAELTGSDIEDSRAVLMSVGWKMELALNAHFGDAAAAADGGGGDAAAARAAAAAGGEGGGGGGADGGASAPPAPASAVDSIMGNAKEPAERGGRTGAGTGKTAGRAGFGGAGRSLSDSTPGRTRGGGDGDEGPSRKIAITFYAEGFTCEEAEAAAGERDAYGRPMGAGAGLRRRRGMMTLDDDDFADSVPPMRRYDASAVETAFLSDLKANVVPEELRQKNRRAVEMQVRDERPKLYPAHLAKKAGRASFGGAGNALGGSGSSDSASEPGSGGDGGGRYELGLWELLRTLWTLLLQGLTAAQTLAGLAPSTSPPPLEELLPHATLTLRLSTGARRSRAFNLSNTVAHVRLWAAEESAPSLAQQQAQGAPRAAFALNVGYPAAELKVEGDSRSVEEAGLAGELITQRPA